LIFKLRHSYNFRELRIYNISDKKYKSTISIGIADLQNYRETLLDVLGHADEALYKVKNRGKNNVKIFNSGI
jgi:diguanylate cyclase (GGDEF)-like protein